MYNHLIERGKLPPGVTKPREGYRETEVHIINENYAVYDNDYPAGAGENEALDYLCAVDKRLAEQSREERKRMSALRLQIKRSRREQAKRERTAEYIDWAMTVLLCALIAAAVMI